jgi:hypothetical protein
MLINKIKIEKKISRDQIIYISAFIIYATIVVVLFVYSIKFLGKTINSAFTQPLTSDIEAKYGQLHLDDYQVVATKLGLTSPTIYQEAQPEQASNQQEQASSTNDTTNDTGPTTTPLASATTADIVSPNNDLSVSNTNSETETKPTISIINSTLTAGLAAGLKTSLQQVGFEILNTGNIRPSEPTTVIKVKASVNQSSSYFSEIKKIVSEKYDFTIVILEETANQDIEIVIGNK